MQDIQEGLVQNMNKRVPVASWDPAVPGLDRKQGGGGWTLLEQRVIAKRKKKVCEKVCPYVLTIRCHNILSTS